VSNGMGPFGHLFLFLLALFSLFSGQLPFSGAGQGMAIFLSFAGNCIILPRPKARHSGEQG
jgi:hypothetical protein